MLQMLVMLVRCSIQGSEVPGEAMQRMLMVQEMQMMQYDLKGEALP